MDEAVANKIAIFRENRSEYEDPRYKEASVRGQFIDPFFRALGWDIHNDQGLPERYKEVEVEPSQQVDGHKRNPDYAFRISGIPKFFVEAKKPYVSLRDSAESALQVRRYSWSAGLPLGILTDFAELAVYDCRVPPSRTDTAATQRVLYLTLDEYEEHWEKLESLFSRAAVVGGSIDRYAAEQEPPANKAIPVGSLFLRDIERWRERLAVDLHSHNPQLSARSLSYLVQATIDRMVFLRICEDRGVEAPESLRIAASGDSSIYRNFLTLFRSADERYNSGLFHFTEERGRSEPVDALSLQVNIGDLVLKEVINDLYPPRSPYAFSTLSVDILGQVYEQFLGSTIEIVGREVMIDQKPEVKKAGGVVYTPIWVVQQMVTESLDSILSSSNPTALRGGGRSTSPLRILDPACGSGSFLIQVYDHLLRWFLDEYQRNSTKWSRGRAASIFSPRPGQWRLTSQERKRIAIDHIFGVDIDPQAVEVTKLSLLLKVLEGETRDSLDRQISLFYERALPDLNANIRCGNSLIGSDLYQLNQIALITDEDEERINSFDWNQEFPFSDAPAKFDLVIGNPPYLSYSGRQAIELHPSVREYFRQKYDGSGWPTSHGLFMERSLKKLSRRMVSFIVPDQVGHLDGYGSVRAIAVQNSTIVSVRYMGEDVFPGRTTPALAFLADKDASGTTSTHVFEPGSHIPSEVALSGSSRWVSSKHEGIIARIAKTAVSLGSAVADPGVHTGNCSKRIILPRANAPGDAVPILEGKNVSRYKTVEPEKVLYMNYQRKEGEYFAVRPWLKYADAKFVIRQTAAEPIVGPRQHATYFRNTLLALYAPDQGWDVRYIVGILNSTLVRWIYRESVRESGQKTFPQVKVKALRALPIKNINLATETDRRAHDQIVELVDRLINLNDQNRSMMSPDELRRSANRSSVTDRQLDELVYSLYGIQEEEIELISNAYARLVSG